MHLKMAAALGMVYVQKGTTLRLMRASRPKVSSWPDGCTNPKNYMDTSSITSDFKTLYVLFMVICHHPNNLRNINRRKSRSSDHSALHPQYTKCP
jgi:hypothetical protein